MDYSIFDELLDTVIILNEHKEVVYLNQASQIYFQTSARKIKRYGAIHNFISFKQKNVYLNKNQPINNENSDTQIESAFETVEGIAGTALIITKVLPNNHTLNFIRDMGLEVNLHKKYHRELKENENLIDKLKQANEQLEVYNHDLEKIVNKRTRELRVVNNYLKTMTNSIGQALLMFDHTLSCLPVHTRAVEVFFGVNPTNKKVNEILNLKSDEEKTFKDWCSICFDGLIPFKDTLKLSLQKFVTTDQYDHPRIIQLEYFPVKNKEGKLTHIVLVGTDITSEEESKKQLEEKNEYVSRILKVIENKNSFISAFEEARNLFNKTSKLLGDFNDLETRNEVLRHIHSIKGICGLYDLGDIVKEVHDIEVKINEYQKEYLLDFPPEVTEIITNRISKLDGLFNNVISSLENILGNSLRENQAIKEVKKTDIQHFINEIENTGTNNLVNSFKKYFCSVSLNEHFKGHELLLSNLAKKLGKELSPFQIIGGDLIIEEELYKDVFSVFGHLFRNCLDHGIEPPDERKQKGKPSQGQISLEAKKLPGELVIDISDDGKGIDTQNLVKKAKEMGIDVKKDKGNILNLIFHPKLSTSEDHNETSGQGIGMSAVKETIEENNGKIEVYSDENIGTTFTITLPLAS